MSHRGYPVGGGGTPYDDCPSDGTDHGLFADYSSTYDAWTVRDTSDNRWWPDNEAQAEIKASKAPIKTILEMVNEQPMRGHWEG